ncbi:hypothetical protein ACSBR1_006208 [Camellia fascicularis]
MAVDVCSEILSLGASPRISFSHDLNNQSDTVRSDASLLDPNFDFHFCISKSFPQELPSADELFSNGKINPIQIKKQVQQSNSILSPEKTGNQNVGEETKKKRLKEFIFSDFDDTEELKPSSRSFWQFRRSNSLNCESGRSKSLIRSLQFLSRSNSTGSAPNPKQIQKQNSVKQQQQQQQQPTISYSRSSSSSSLYTKYNPYNSSKKPPLKKNCRAYGNGVRISPVLNIPHNCIAKGTASLFGFGSLFCNGKDKKKKK